MNKIQAQKERRLISILLPVFNEGPYLAQCLESILAQDRADFEVCISDNVSTDNTWEIISKYSQIDSRIKPFRQDHAVHPYENLMNTLSRAAGEYVYYMGGDDYILPGLFKEALAHFEHEPDLQVVVGRMHYFSDKDGSILSTNPPPKFDLKLNTPAPELVNFLLRNIEHDEIALSVLKRADFGYVMNLLDMTSQESFGIWIFMGAALRGKNSAQRVRITSDVYLMKRYEKPESASSFHKSANIVQDTAISQYLAYCRKSRGSILNTVRFYKAGLFSWRELMSFLLAPRFHSALGLHKVSPLISPAWILVEYPIKKIRAALARMQ